MRPVETLIIGAGQAGLALSRLLSEDRSEHIVLERGRVGERWRSERWDSLTLLTPNWLNRLPGAPALPDADGYADRAAVIAHLEAYAARAPVHERTTVLGVQRGPGGYEVATDDGVWFARNVVIASGDCDVPNIPALEAAAPPELHQLHATAYRRPSQLPPGGVLVVGAGPTGQQLALELRGAGRTVVLAAGRHARMPRRYRGHDVFTWQAATGQLDMHADEVHDLATERRTPSFPVTGSGGGASLGLERLAGLGVVVTGRLDGFAGRHAIFAPDLRENVADAERGMRRVLARIDRHIARTGAPAGAPDAPPPVALGPGPSSLDLGAITTILWATGYRRTYPWLHVPVLDAGGEVVQREGVTAAPGLFTLGLRFQRTRKSHLLGGVGDDAAFIAAQVRRRGGGELDLARAA